MQGAESSSHHVDSASVSSTGKIPGGMVFKAPARTRNLIVCLGVLIIGLHAPEANFEIASCKSEAVLREAVTATLRQEGLDGPITILRDDTRSLKLWPSESDKFVFYEVIEGGYGRNKDGIIVLMPVSHPLEWRVLVDCQTARVYRMYGFQSGGEFSAVIESMGLKTDEGGAEF